MNPDQQHKPQEPRPWFAILVGAFLTVSGIGASVYGYIAVTWTGDTNSQVVHVKPPESLALADDNDIDDVDRPIRTSTTRRRRVPRSVTNPPKTVPTTIAKTYTEEVDTTNSADTTAEVDDEQQDSETQDAETVDQPTDESSPAVEPQPEEVTAADPITPETTQLAGQ